MTENTEIGKPCEQYDLMLQDWELIITLLGGTRAMRDAGEKYLPREAAEGLSAYSARLNRSVLFNGYRDTIQKLCNKPFSKSIIINNLPEELLYLFDDVDGCGKTFETLSKELLEDLINYGKAHIFVDHSTIPVDIENPNKVLTKAEEEELGLRVYLNRISPINLIGWQTNKSIMSRTIDLTQIRIHQEIYESNSEYKQEKVVYILVYSPNYYAIYKKSIVDGKEVYNLVIEGNFSFGYIPLITIYANQIDVLTSESPLLDLAWLNLAHWQSSSDQKNILRFSRFGLLFGRGLPKDMVEKGSIEIGPNKAILTSDPNADLHYVESTGGGIDAGRKDVEAIELQMEAVGQQPLVKTIPISTATGQRIDESRNVSLLQSWVRNLERGLKQTLELACEWRKIVPIEEIFVDIFDDFSASIENDVDKNLLISLRSAGEITRRTLLEELNRRNLFNPNFSVDDELEQLEEEGAKELERYMKQLPEKESETESEEV